MRSLWFGRIGLAFPRAFAAAGLRWAGRFRGGLGIDVQVRNLAELIICPSSSGKDPLSRSIRSCAPWLLDRK
jgi:hypothetical protein